MQELIERFIEEGLTEEQAENTVWAVSQWLDEHYPVAGVLASALIRKSTIKSNS